MGWMAAYASQKGFRYEPEADERWMRAWEPYVTLRVPARYEHALQATGELGSLTIARLVVEAPAGPAGVAPRDGSSWIVIAQDVRIEHVMAASCDTGGVFSDPLEHVAMTRRASGDPAFDRVFAAFAPTSDDLHKGLTPSLRKLVLGWQTPLHFELRRGGFVLAPVNLASDPQSLAWLVRAVHLFGEKATKRTVAV